MKVTTRYLAATALLALAACSETTEDNAQATLDSMAADTKATLEVAGDELEDGAAKVDAGVDEFQAKVEAERANNESDRPAAEPGDDAAQ